MKTNHLTEMMACFEGRVVCADDGKIANGRGKPCPDIFLVAAKELLGREVGMSEGDDVSPHEDHEQ